MQPVPRIFVSATSRDLRTARGLVSEGLRRMECLPIVQDDFPPDYKSVRDMLRTKVSTCNAVVHLAGFYYGAEPQPVLPGPDRRSFTQMEYEIAMELKLPCYVFLCGKDFPFDKHDPEPEDKAQLQLDHRARLLQRDELFYEFASPEELSNRTRELQLSVEGLRKELAKERARRRLAMTASVAALVIAIGGGTWLFRGQQKQETVISQQSADLAKLQARLEELSVVVAQVNTAQEQARRDGVADKTEYLRVALQTVATDTGKSVEQVQESIDATTRTAEEVAAAARAQGAKDAAKLAESRRIEADALLQLGAAHEAAGRYEKALAAYTEGLALLDRAQEPQKWVEATKKAGWMQHQLEDFAQARALYEAALDFAAQEPKLGLSHTATLSLTSGLSSTLVRLKDFAAAEQLNRRVLQACEDQLKVDAPETLRAMGGLAAALVWKRHYTLPSNASAADVAAADEALVEGEALARRAIRASERVQGEDSFETIALVGTLAHALTLKKDFEGAVAAYERVQKYREKTFGPDADITMSGAIILANTLNSAGDLEGAETLHRRALAWREKKLGPDHPETIESLNALGITLLDAKKSADAEPLFKRGFTAATKTLGPENSTTMSLAFSLASILRDREDYAGAEPLFRQRLAWREKTSGPDTTSTALAAALLADVLASKDTDEDRAEALKFYRFAHKIQVEKLGPDHAMTKGSGSEIERLEKP